MFEWITSIIRRLGYTGVALTLLENVFPPIPSELVIPLAGYVAAFMAWRYFQCWRPAPGAPRGR